MITCLAALCITGAVAIHGDTLRLDGPGKDLRLRLWGISAPEIRDPGGVEASRALASLIEGQPLSCDLMDVDRYDRPVVRCDLPSGADLGCEMIRAGHAEEWRQYSRGAYADCAASASVASGLRSPPAE